MTLLVYGILSEHTSNLMQIADSLPYWVKMLVSIRDLFNFLKTEEGVQDKTQCAESTKLEEAIKGNLKELGFGE